VRNQLSSCPCKRRSKKHERGAGLIVVIIVIAFMLSVGLAVITLTSSGTQVSGNLRLQEHAFEAAEAGFDAAWLALGDFFDNAGWTTFESHYVLEPYGIDIPIDQNYFRKQTDMEVMNLIGDYANGTATSANVLFYKQPYVPLQGGGYDPDHTYTAFLINDEAGGGDPNPMDALLVCIGVVDLGGSITTSRLEIELVVEQPGT